MASQIAVTATLTDPSGTGLNNPTNSNAYLRFRLRNFSGFVPTVSGTAIICETQIDALPGASGAVSQALWGNANITPSSTFYTVEVWSQGRITSSGNYIFNANTNLNTAAQINTPPVPAGFSLILENNGALNSSQSTLNLESTDGTVKITDEGSGTLNLQSSSPNWHGFGCSGNVSEISPFACSPYTSGVSAVVAATATDPAYYQLQTGSSSNSQAQMYDNGAATSQQGITLGILSSVKYRAQLVSTTNQRVWLAMSDTGSATGNLVSDTPNQNVVGFRYSTHAGDTAWMCYCGTASASYTAVSSGVAASTTGHTFSIQYSAGTALFYIDGTLVGSIATNVPATSVKMQNCVNVDNINMANSISLNLSYSYWSTTV